MNPSIDKHWKSFYLFSASFNLLGALVALVAQDFFFRLFFQNKISPSSELLFFHDAFWGCVAAFGIGYAMIAFRLNRYPGIVFIGILGKVYFAGLVILFYCKGIVSWIALGGGLADLLFAVFFGFFFHKNKSFWVRS